MSDDSMDQVEIDANDSQMFDDEAMDSPVKDLLKGVNQEEMKIARPTTKPTDRHKKLENSYTFWKEQDPEKLKSFPQFTDASYI